MWLVDPVATTLEIFRLGGNLTLTTDPAGNQVQIVLRVNPKTVYSAVVAGQLRHVRLGRKIPRGAGRRWSIKRGRGGDRAGEGGPCAALVRQCCEQRLEMGFVRPVEGTVRANVIVVAAIDAAAEAIAAVVVVATARDSASACSGQ